MAERKIRNYTCYDEKDVDINEDVQEKLGISFPEAYQEADQMAKLSKYRKEDLDSPYCNLPFCNTLESEAMGGNVNFGDAKVGPRPADPIVKKLDEVLGLEDIDFSQGRIKETLDAAVLLRDSGEKVIYEISGPISILNGLVDSSQIFISMRRDKDTLAKVYEKIHKNLLEYVKELVDREIEIISYADSATSVDILGGKMVRQYLDDFVIGFLQEAQEILGDKTLIHLCPKTTFALVDSAKADFVPIKVDESKKYGQVFEEALGKEKILGSRCIKNINSHMKKGELQAVRLK